MIQNKPHLFVNIFEHKPFINSLWLSWMIVHDWSEQKEKKTKQKHPHTENDTIVKRWNGTTISNVHNFCSLFMCSFYRFAENWMHKNCIVHCFKSKSKWRMHLFKFIDSIFPLFFGPSEWKIFCYNLFVFSCIYLKRKMKTE